MYTYVHIHKGTLHTYTHEYIHAYIHACRHNMNLTCMHAYMHTHYSYTYTHNSHRAVTNRCFQIGQKSVYYYQYKRDWYIRHRRQSTGVSSCTGVCGCKPLCCIGCRNGVAHKNTRMLLAYAIMHFSAKFAIMHTCTHARILSHRHDYTAQA